MRILSGTLLLTAQFLAAFSIPQSRESPRQAPNNAANALIHKENVTTQSSGRALISREGETVNWFSARQTCQWVGLELSTFETEEEMRNVAAGNSKKYNYWVSASDVGRPAGQFAWVDGTPVPASFWAPGQPSSFGQGGPSCVLLSTADAKLANFDCRKGRNLVLCEMAKSANNN